MGTARVRTRTEFTALRQRGGRSRRRALQVTYLPGPDGPAVAYAIGKPVGTAVVRNRLRRRLRALVVELAPPTGTYLVAATPSATSLTFAELRIELATAFDEATAVARARS